MRLVGRLCANEPERAATRVAKVAAHARGMTLAAVFRLLEEHGRQDRALP